MKCPVCNKELNNGQLKFCPFCGCSLESIVKTAPNNQPENKVPAGRPPVNRPQSKGSAAGRPPVNRPQGKGPAAGRPPVNRPQGKGPAAGRPPVNRPSANRPSANGAPPVRPSDNRPSSNQHDTGSTKKIVIGILIAVLFVVLGVGGYFAASKLLSDNGTKSTEEKSREEDRDKDSAQDKEHDPDSNEDADKESDKKSDKEAVSFNASSTSDDNKKDSENTQKKETEKARDKEKDSDAVTFVPEEDESDPQESNTSGNAAGYVPEESGENDYLCYIASDRLLTDSDYQAALREHPEIFPGNRTLAQMIENELFARHGYIFSNQELNDYFLQFEWYQIVRNSSACSNNQEVIMKGMSTIEKSNIKFLDRYIPD